MNNDMQLRILYTLYKINKLQTSLIDLFAGFKEEPLYIKLLDSVEDAYNNIEDSYQQYLYHNLSKVQNGSV